MGSLIKLCASSSIRLSTSMLRLVKQFGKNFTEFFFMFSTLSQLTSNTITELKSVFKEITISVNNLSELGTQTPIQL